LPILYVPTHVHTAFSVLDGLAKTEDLVAKAKEFGMPAIAVTDHRNTAAHVKFYRVCQEAEIKPLLGVELNEADDRLLHSRKARQERGYDDYHIIMIAKNQEGYKNLMEIVSDASTAGYFDKTEQTDMTVLRERGRGIIATSACLAGRIPRYILQNRLDDAERWISDFKEVFDQFYLEIQPNSLPEQAVVNEALIQLARKTNTPLILGTDVHYVNREDAFAQDILLCIQTGKKLKDQDRLKFNGDPDYYMWSPEEIDKWIAASSLPHDALYEAVENTLRVAEECDVTLDLGTHKMPTFKTPDGSTPEDYLTRICYTELDRRFADHPDYGTYKARLEMELSVIIPKGFASYFLILQDILDYCRRQGIPRGGGRGSAAGCFVAYLLGITTIDPIQNGLLFER